METNILIIFGAGVRQFRLAQQLSQEQLALKANLDRTYISGVERGVRNISLLNIQKIANALNVTLPVLFNAIQPPTEENQ